MFSLCVSVELGFAEWDKPPPPLPKISPYLADLALVAKRRQIILPNGELVMYKRSMITMQPLFLAVRAPEKPKDTIKVMEDGRRLKVRNVIVFQLHMTPSVIFGPLIASNYCNTLEYPRGLGIPRKLPCNASRRS